MPARTTSPKTPVNDRRGSTESFGQGQSGSMAGRVEGDPSLQQESRNASYPDRRDEHPRQLGVDDRFAGAGGAPWVPREEAPTEDAEEVPDLTTSSPD